MARRAVLGTRAAQVAQAKISAAAIARRANMQIAQLVGRGFQEMVATAIVGAGLAVEDAGEYLQRMADTFIDVREGLAADAVTLGELVQEDAWDYVDSHRKRSIDPRTNARLHGTLQRAISQMVQPTYDGIVIRTDILDQEAAHWRRVNYGAGNMGTADTFGIPPLAQPGPSAGFRIPRGYWEGSAFRPAYLYGMPRLRDQGAGHPEVITEPRMTKGIRGVGFLEHAFAEAEKVFPMMVQARIKAWADLNSTMQGVGRSVKGVMR